MLEEFRATARIGQIRQDPAAAGTLDVRAGDSRGGKKQARGTQRRELAFREQGRTGRRQCLKQGGVDALRHDSFVEQALQRRMAMHAAF